MRLLPLAIAVALLSACTSSPTAPSLPPAPPVSTASAASIQLLASTRPDQQLDVAAKVLTAQGAFVQNVAVTFAVDAGSVNPASAMTDANGLAHTIVTTSGKVTITATSGALTTKLDALSSAAPLAVSLFVPAVTVGTASAFTASVAGLAPGASVTSYAWDFGDANGTQTATGSASHLYAAVGSFNTSVTIVDSQGRTARGLAVAAVNAVPLPPPPPPPPAPSYSVAVSASPTAVLIGASSTLTATVTAQNGAPTPTTYAWDCDGDGAIDFTTAGNSQACAYPAVGTVTSKVTVSGGAVTGTGSTTVTVTAAQLFVTISPSTSTPTVGAMVTFTATVTSVGAIPALLQWQWDDTNDGTYDAVVGSAVNPNARVTSYGAAGAVTIKVLVTDIATGRTATGTRTVTVQ